MKLTLLFEGRCKSKANNNRPWLPAEYVKYERTVAWYAHQQMKQQNIKMFTTPVFVKIIFYFKPGIRLDVFNGPKSICDGLNKIVYSDDRLIHKGYVEIRTDIRERIEMEVWNITEAQETLAFENTLQIK